MAWTTPMTEAAGNVWTAAHYNTYVRDNINALRDYMLGAQDLASNWKISSGRTLQFQESGVLHGMTTLLPTDNWFQIAETTAGAGGATLIGARDTDQLGITLHGVNGSATPTVAGLALQASKKNGTTTQSFASTEKVMQFYNGGTVLADWYGSGLNIAGGLSVGYSGAPAASNLYIGDANFRLAYNGGTDPGVLFDTNDDMTYTRAVNTLNFNFAGNTTLSVSATAVGIGGVLQIFDPLVNLGGGAAPTLGTIGGAGPATAAQNKWLRLRDAVGADFWVPLWK
jgi:hypothetical protein